MYQIADYRNSADIAGVWSNLLTQTHQLAVGKYEKTQPDQAAPQPWEVVAEAVRSMGAKLQLSESTFPIEVVLPLVGRYHVDHILAEDGMGTGVQGGGSGRNPQVAGPGPNWVVEILMSLNVPFETLLTVLEAMFHENEAPWTGKRNRGLVAGWMMHVIQKWFQESLTAGAAGGLVFGGEENAIGVLESLRNIENAAVLNADGVEEARALRARIEGVLR